MKQTAKSLDSSRRCKVIIGAVMMALQRSLLEQSDIVPTLKDMKLKQSEQGLVVLNPPIVRAAADAE